MNLHVLKPADPMAKQLVDWMERGVADALSHGFLKALYFGISADREHNELLEVGLTN